MGDIIDTIQISIIVLIIHVLSSGICNLDRLFLKMQCTGFPAKNVLVKIAAFLRSKSLCIFNMQISLTLTKTNEFVLSRSIDSYNTRFQSNLTFHRPSIINNYGATTFAFVGSKIWENIPYELKKLYILLV